MPRRALHLLARRAAFATAAASSPRGPFSTLTPADVAAFRAAVGDAGVVTDPMALAAYNTCVFGVGRKDVTVCVVANI